MKNASPEVDAYIERADGFARPILVRLRRLFHKACPEIEETLKWGCPHFVHGGIVGCIASFTQHVSYGFWKGRLLKDPRGLFKGVGRTSMAAAKVRTMSDLPPDRVLIGYIREAVRLNDAGVKAPRPRRAVTAKKLAVPAYLMAALRRNRKALATFTAFSPSNRKDYVEWVTQAKQDATRQRRLETAVKWMAEGRPRNWKYMTPRRCP